MVDCTLTLLIRRAKEAEYLLSNEGSHRLSQGVLTTTKDLLRLPMLSRGNVNRGGKASNVRSNIFGTVEESLPYM